MYQPAPLTSRRACVADGPTPASALLLEKKLLGAYRDLHQREVAQLWPPERRKKKAIAVLGGNLAATQQRHAEARLAEAMPELIQRLTLEQQPVVADLLLCEGPDLTKVVALLVKLERNLNYRDDDANLKLNDDGKLRAAGMGWLSKQQYGTRPLGDPLVLTPWVPAPKLRTAKRRHAARRPAPALRTRQLALWPPVGVLLGAMGITGHS